MPKINCVGNYDCIYCDEESCIAEEITFSFCYTFGNGSSKYTRCSKYTVFDNKLKDCPCCGSSKVKVEDTIINTSDGDLKVYQIWCLECNMQTMQYHDIHEAYRTWNKREKENGEEKKL